MFTVEFSHGSKTITMSGECSVVLDAISKLVGYDVEVRDNPQSDDGLPQLVVDRSQAESYPAYDGEVIEPPPGWEDRAVDRARAAGVLSPPAAP